MTIYTLSIVGALFRYPKRWNISLHGCHWGVWGRQKRASADGIPSSGRVQVKDPKACAHAGAKPSAGCGTFKDLSVQGLARDFGPNWEMLDSLPAFGDQALTV
jgi:hypothetical protein